MQKFFIAIALFVVVGLGVMMFNRSDESRLYPENEISHSHGLAVDNADSNKLYIATHYGLLVLQNEKELYRIGKSKDDYMGFTPHPTAPNTFFSSGHPVSGGNLGFQKSEDGGLTWEKVSNGAQGTVDFHAMAISPVDPSILYGWYENQLQRSLDGGESWEILSTNLTAALNLVADSQNEDIVFATGLEGLMRSKDKGVTWENFSEDLKNGVVVALAVHPNNSQKLFSFSQKLGLARSEDGGITWQKIDEPFGGSLLLFIVFDPNNPEKMFTLTRSNVIYRSSDGGKTWTKIY